MHSHAFCPSIHVLPDQFELVFYCSFDFIYFLYFKIITHSIRAHFSLRSSFQEYCSRFPASSSPHWGTYIHPSRYALFSWLDCPFHLSTKNQHDVEYQVFRRSEERRVGKESRGRLC